MELAHFDKDTRRLAEAMLEARSRNDPKVMRFSSDLTKRGMELGDHALLGFGYYYSAEAFFLFGHYDKFHRNLASGMKYQQELSQKDLLARSYNLLAIDAMNHGSTELGLGYFLRALRMSEKCGDRYQMSIIRMNIGMVYMRLCMERTALTHLRQSLSLIRTCKKEYFYAFNMLTAVCAQGECYLRLGKTDGARKAMARAEQILASGEIILTDNLNLVPFHCFQAKLYHSQGDFKKRDDSLADLLTSLERTRVVTDIFDDICELCSFMLDIGKTGEAKRVIDRIEPMIKKAGALDLRFRLSALCVRYYRACGDAAKIHRAEAAYYDISVQMQEERIESYQHSVQIQMGMEELQKQQMAILEENVRLTRQAQSDPLTGLPNRYLLNTASEAAFERAYRGQATLAVCILDIDHFKEYNDTCGHQAGDECLIRVARAINTVCDDGGGFCARYGGDEFVILYEGLTDDEVLARAERLRNAVTGMQIPHRASSVAPYVTISQGMRNSVPVEENRLWDYLYAADNALYRVKKTQKGGVLLIHNARISPTAFTE